MIVRPALIRPAAGVCPSPEGWLGAVPDVAEDGLDPWVKRTVVS